MLLVLPPPAATRAAPPPPPPSFSQGPLPDDPWYDWVPILCAVVSAGFCWMLVTISARGELNHAAKSKRPRHIEAQIPYLDGCQSEATTCNTV